MIIPGALAQQALLALGGGGLAPPEIGDEWTEQGGWYIGEYVLGGSTYYLVDGGAASEPVAAVQAKTSATTTTGAGSTMDGISNTAAMMVSPGVHPAANHCRLWTGGGLTDWYMPSSAELQLIRNNLWQGVVGVNANYSSTGAQRYAVTGGTGGTGALYWASDQASAGAQMCLRMTDNAMLTTVTKTNSRWVRPIRRVLKS